MIEASTISTWKELVGVLSGLQERIRINLRVEAASPWLISCGYGRNGADLSPILDPDGLPEIPEESMRGLARDAAESIVDWHPKLGTCCRTDADEATGFCQKCSICRIFGSPPFKPRGWHISRVSVPPLPRALFLKFDNGSSSGLLHRTTQETVTRTQIDGVLGKAAKNRLFRFEIASSDFPLEGFVEERIPLCGDPNVRGRDLLLLCAALRLLQRVGYQRLKGLGLVKVTLTGGLALPGLPDVLPSLVEEVCRS